MHAIKIPKCKISKLKSIGKEKIDYQYFDVARSSKRIFETCIYCFKPFYCEKTGNKKKYSTTEKSIPKSLNASTATINKMINQYLQFKNFNKNNDQFFFPKHVAQSRRICRTMSEN